MPSTRQIILYHPLARIIIGLALTLGVGIAAMYGTQQLLSLTSQPASINDPVSGTIFAILAGIVYIQLYKRYEKRRITELSTRKLPQYLIAGILIGASITAATILTEYLAHALTITATRSFLPLLPNLWNTFVNSIVAELLIIGIVFRIAETWLGSYITLSILFVVFVILHLSATGDSPASAICVALHAAFLCTTSYMYTRSLWTPIAIHFAWDFSFAAIYGASINGYTMDNSLLHTSINGPDWLTGGYFGPQGSIQAGILCLLTGALLLNQCRRHHQILPPSFRKTR